VGVKKFHEILQQICENLEGWSKNFQKCQFGPKIFLVGGSRLRIFSGGGYRLSTPHTLPPGIMYEPILRRKRNSEFSYYLDFRPLSEAGAALFGSERHHGDLPYFFIFQGIQIPGSCMVLHNSRGNKK
jgi:hypothetical protein